MLLVCRCRDWCLGKLHSACAVSRNELQGIWGVGLTTARRPALAGVLEWLFPHWESNALVRGIVLTGLFWNWVNQSEEDYVQTIPFLSFARCAQCFLFKKQCFDMFSPFFASVHLFSKPQTRTPHRPLQRRKWYGLGLRSVQDVREKVREGELKLSSEPWFCLVWGWFV